jgi:energy-coupling factor transport system permease protein
MDSRGYGRRADRSPVARRASAAALLLGLGGAVAGTYQVIGGARDHGVGLTLLVVGPAVALAGGLLAGSRGRRTRYRPDRWRWAETLVVGCAAVVVVAYQFTVADSPAAGVPFAWPALELVPFLATLVAAVPALATPPVPTAPRRARLAVATP